MKIIIVGGGNTAWLSAFILKTHFPFHQIIVLDSSKNEILGVGESTTGVFSHLLHSEQYNISISEFLEKCDATHKLGIKFIGWNDRNKIFYGPIDGSVTGTHFFDSALYYSIFENKDVLQASKLGILINSKSTAFLKNHYPDCLKTAAYHFDTHKTNIFFKQKSINLGVIHENFSAIDAQMNDIGDIKSVVLDDGRVIEADFFIDATGFSRFFTKYLKNEFISYEDYLPVNSALPFIEDHSIVKFVESVTTAKTMSSGWMWMIPTKNKMGCGYVYCDKFISDDDALEEIKKVTNKDVNPYKKIKFKTGRLKDFWVKNCLFVGPSASFLEPLESTSIHTTLMQIYKFADKCLRFDKKTTCLNANILQYNEYFSKLVDSFADFISCHYSGGKTNTEFWKSIKIRENTKNIIELSKNRCVFDNDFNSEWGFAGNPLWSYILYGTDNMSKENLKQLYKWKPHLYEWGKTAYRNNDVDVKNFISNKNFF